MVQHRCNVRFVPKAAKMPLLDHLVGAAGQGQWHGDAERLCGFEIDD
jgi:hypothetical protein